MNGLIDAAFQKKRTVLLILFVLLVTGVSSFISIPKESAPDINIPIIYVSAELRGISAVDAERLLVRPLEQELKNVEGVKEMRSKSYLGGGNVILEFEAGFDADNALNDVREKVDDAKPELPSEAEEPTVHEVNFSLFPVITVILSGEVPERTLLKLGRGLRDEIETIGSVLEVTIQGNREEQVEVLLDPLRLESYGLTNSTILANIQGFNKLVAAGSLDTGQGRFEVNVPGLFETVHDIYRMPITTSGDAIVEFQDLADIRSTFEDPKGFARVNGTRAITLDVKKRTGENVIDTIERVRHVVENYTKSWPENIQISYSGDNSKNIKDMLADLQNNVISAVLLVMIVVVAVLGLRSAGLVGVAIPGSFLTGILVIYTLGLTVNIVVLFSLILAVGMLVDGSIVLTEYADRRMKEGAHPQLAYSSAAKRMAWPITASTATTLSAFMPLLFWPGVTGEFMKFMPITLLATLSASLLMALVFVPVLGSIIMKTSPFSKKKKEQPKTQQSAFAHKYVSVLGKALNHPGLVISATVALLISVFVVYGKYGKGVEFFPDVEPDRAKLLVHARGNLSVYEKDALIKEVEEIVLNVKDKYNEFETVYALSGDLEDSEESEDIIGQIQLEFKEWDTRRSATIILDEILDKTSVLAGISVEARKEEGGPPVGKPIEIEISSYDRQLIEKTVKKIVGGFRQVGQLINIEDGLPIPGIEWELNVDRSQAARFGANIELVGAAIQLVTNGYEFSSYRPDNSDEDVPIVARFSDKYRTIQQLDNVRVTTELGNIPISNFVERAPKPRTGTINRTDGKRSITVKADVEEGLLASDKLKEVQDWIAKADIDPRVDIKFKGEDQEQKEAGEFLSKAFMVAIFVMAIILVTQFNSFYSAFLILSAVIMSTIGVFIGLMIMNEPFGIVMSGVGVIALAGIVVNNNIVLIDTYDHLIAKGMKVKEAIIETGIQRLRPVLLTTVTTILGLIPMVLQLNIDFVNREFSYGAPSTQWWVQLATVIVFGLAFATILTLIVTPCSLMIRGNVHNWIERKKQKYIKE